MDEKQDYSLPAQPAFSARAFTIIRSTMCRCIRSYISLYFFDADNFYTPISAEKALPLIEAELVTFSSKTAAETESVSPDSEPIKSDSEKPTEAEALDTIEPCSPLCLPLAGRKPSFCSISPL